MATIADPRTLTQTNDHASQWQLIWSAFRRHKLAMTGAVIVVCLYLVALFCEFLAPFDPDAPVARDVYHPPQAIHFLDTTPNGGWTFRRM
jgi:peptide/nickel transport system permease protein